MPNAFTSMPAPVPGGVAGPVVLPARAFKRPEDLPQSPTDLALLRAVQMWLTGDPPQLVAKVIGCKPDEMSEMVTRKGWRFLEDCVRDDVSQIALSNLTRITHKCFRLLDERLEKGDPIYDPDGNIIGYRAIRAKDLSNIATQMIDKHLEIERRIDRIDEKDSLALEELAKSLRNYALEKRFREAKSTIDVSPSS